MAEHISPDLAEVTGLVAAMHTKWVQREELMRQSGGLALMERMADLMDGIVDAVPELQRKLLAAIANAPAIARANLGVEQTCSCMEVYGEDPNCIKHGRGTKWAKENPDICELAEKAAAYDRLAPAGLEALRELSEKATQGEWEVDREHDPDAEYGPGPDPGVGFDNFMILAGNGEKIMGTENSAWKEIVEDGPDEEGYSAAYDEAGWANANFAVAAVNYVRALLAEPAEGEADIDAATGCADDAMPGTAEDWRAAIDGELPIGHVQWHSSEEGGGPDVGALLRLSESIHLWCGEITSREASEYDTGELGWHLVLHRGEARQHIARCSDEYLAREFMDVLAAAIRQRKGEGNG